MECERPAGEGVKKQAFGSYMGSVRFFVYMLSADVPHHQNQHIKMKPPITDALLD